MALVTPFVDGKVDVRRLEELVEWHVQAGTSGLVPCGTTGESATLSHDEHDLVIRTVVETAGGRLPVIAGTGSNSTAEAVRLTRYAEEVGADGALVITPYYNRPTQAGLVAHFREIARSVSLPIVLYNVPARTGVDMQAATVLELASIPNVVGVKEASGKIDTSVEILRGAPHLSLLSGDDSLTLPLLSIGAKGVISVAANVAPEAMADLVAAGLRGDFGAARELHYRLFPLFHALFVETSPIPVKEAMSLLGRAGPEIRAPMTRATAATRARLEGVLVELGMDVVRSVGDGPLGVR